MCWYGWSEYGLPTAGCCGTPPPNPPPPNSLPANSPPPNGEGGVPVGRGSGVCRVLSAEKSGAAGAPPWGYGVCPCGAVGAPVGAAAGAPTLGAGLGAAARGAVEPTGSGRLFCRGRNHSPVDSASDSPCWAPAGAWAPPGTGVPPGGVRQSGAGVGSGPAPGAAGAAGRRRAPASGSAACSSGLTVLRITTGGIGREPGMLIEIRVVSVVSVLGTSGSVSSWAAGLGEPKGSPPKPFASPGMP